MTNLYDCFLDDFRDEEFFKAISDLDTRAQLEVLKNTSFNFVSFFLFNIIVEYFRSIDHVQLNENLKEIIFAEFKQFLKMY